MGIAPASIVVGNSGTIQVDDLLYSLGGEPNVSLGSVLVNTPAAEYNASMVVSSGKQITGVQAGDIINLNLGTVTQMCTVNNTSSALSGSVFFRANLLRTSTGGVLSGTTVNPSSYVYSVRENAGADSEIVSGSGIGSRCDFDLTGLNGIYYVRIQWYFGIKSFTVPTSFVGSSVWLGFSTSTNVYSGSGNDDVARQEEIIAGINEGNSILSMISSGISNVWSAITALPGKIAEAIKGLFVPSQEDLTAIKAKYEQLLADRLGFVYQAGDMVTDFFTDFSSALQSDAEYEFVFPGIAFPMNGEMIVICEEMPVDLDNDVMAALRPVLGTIITIISVLGFLNVASDMFEAMISGKSYHDFLHRKDDDG